VPIYNSHNFFGAHLAPVFLHTRAGREEVFIVC